MIAFWAWEGWSALVAIGTISLALGTIGLAAAAFWQIVGESRSRPKLALERDEEGIQTRLEADGRRPWIRLLVRNGSGRRSATGTRVLVDRYRETHYATPPVSLAGPELAWPSAEHLPAEGAVVFSGTARPLDFGVLSIAPIERPESVNELLLSPLTEVREGYKWWFRFALAMHTRSLVIGREFLPPIAGGYTAQLTVGAYEGAAQVFDVAFDWMGHADTAEAALASFTLSIKPAGRIGRGRSPA